MQRALSRIVLRKLCLEAEPGGTVVRTGGQANAVISRATDKLHVATITPPANCREVFSVIFIAVSGLVDHFFLQLIANAIQPFLKPRIGHRAKYPGNEFPLVIQTTIDRALFEDPTPVHNLSSLSLRS